MVRGSFICHNCHERQPVRIHTNSRKSPQSGFFADDEFGFWRVEDVPGIDGEPERLRRSAFAWPIEAIGDGFPDAWCPSGSGKPARQVSGTNLRSIIGRDLRRIYLSRERTILKTLRSAPSGPPEMPHTDNKTIA